MNDSGNNKNPQPSLAPFSIQEMTISIVFLLLNNAGVAWTTPTLTFLCFIGFSYLLTFTQLNAASAYPGRSQFYFPGQQPTKSNLRPCRIKTCYQLRLLGQ